MRFLNLLVALNMLLSTWCFAGDENNNELFRIISQRATMGIDAFQENMNNLIIQDNTDIWFQRGELNALGHAIVLGDVLAIALLLGAIRTYRGEEVLRQYVNPQRVHDNYAPLYLAVVYELLAVIPILVNAGADVNFEFHVGMGPFRLLDLAYNRGQQEVVGVLERRDATRMNAAPEARALPPDQRRTPPPTYEEATTGWPRFPRGGVVNIGARFGDWRRGIPAAGSM